MEIIGVFLKSLSPDFLIQIIVTGVVYGCVYALAAIGIVVIYKSSGVYNFAQGQILRETPQLVAHIAQQKAHEAGSCLRP